MAGGSAISVHQNCGGGGGGGDFSASLQIRGNKISVQRAGSLVLACWERGHDFWICINPPAVNNDHSLNIQGPTCSTSASLAMYNSRILQLGCLNILFISNIYRCQKCVYIREVICGGIVWQENVKIHISVAFMLLFSHKKSQLAYITVNLFKLDTSFFFHNSTYTQGCPSVAQ